MYKAKSYYECPPYPDGKYYKEWSVNFEKKISIITINKCAGSSIRNCLFDYGFTVGLIDYHFLQNYLEMLDGFKFYAFVRDPNKRYVSGLSEFLFLYYKNYDEEYIERNLQNNKFIFDHHTIPQSDNIVEGTEIIKLDSNLSDNISKIVGENISIPKLNATTDKLNFEQQIDFCGRMFEKYCLNNPEYLNLYKKDFELYV